MLFLNPAYLAVSLFELSDFQHYSMDCEFTYQSLFKQWSVLELIVHIGQGQ